MGDRFPRFEREWPFGYRDGDAVLFENKKAHVVAADAGIVPKGKVPIIFDSEIEKEGELVCVPADDLERIKEDWEQ